MRRAVLILIALVHLFATSAVAEVGDRETPFYRIDLAVDRGSGALDAAVRIDIPRAQAATTFLLAATHRITAAESRNGTVTIGPNGGGIPGTQTITVTRRSPGPLDLMLRYAGPLGPSGEPPMNEISAARVELNLDSFWLPVVSGFTTRFAAVLNLRGVPSDWSVVSSGEARREGDRFVITRQTADVDMAFMATPGFASEVAPGFRIYATDLQTPAARLYRHHGAEAVRWLERWFGPLPHAPVRLVVARRARQSGYARAGYVVVTEGAAISETSVAKFVAHEFSHAWWAPVDPGTDNRWLQESIAEYVALRYVESSLGEDAVSSLVRGKRIQAAGAGAIIGHGPGGDAELYAKGPLLLISLEGHIGRGTLDALLAQLARQPPSTTSQFLDALRDRAGTQAAEIFERQLRYE